MTGKAITKMNLLRGCPINTTPTRIPTSAIRSILFNSFLVKIFLLSILFYP